VSNVLTKCQFIKSLDTDKFVRNNPLLSTECETAEYL
jgi:hypothetical protein